MPIPSRALSVWLVTSISILLVFSLGADGFSGVHSCGMVRSQAEAEATLVPRQYAPSRKIDITHQLLDVTPDFDRRSVTGRIRIEFHPIALPLEELRLDAVDLAISTVEASAPLLGWHNTGKHLVLTFREPIPAEEASWVEVSYSVDEPERGLYFRTPAMGYRVGDTHLWTQGEAHEARHWFPSYDYPNEKFTSEMICHVPADMVALSNGRLVSREANPERGLVAWRWLQDKPHVNYLITLCAGYFEKIEDTADGVVLAFWTPPSQIEFAKNSFAGTRDMMNFFEQEIGVAYPWARYDQVVVDDFAWGGMENTAQTTLSDRTLYPDELAGTRSSLGLVAHELAHQWFGNYVTCKDWSHLWLNEGFATYYESLFREHAHGRDEFLWAMLQKSRAVLDQPEDQIPMVHRGYVDPEEQFSFRAYPKGAWVLHMLRSQLGPELYRQCVQAYLERHPFGVVTTEDLVKVFEERSGRDWDRFFDQYVYHAQQPHLRVDYSWDERTGLARISIEQIQPLGPNVLLFHLPVTIRFQSASRRTEVVAQVSLPREDFYFALPTRPEVVRIDPEFEWLAKIELPVSAEMLHAQLGVEDDMIGRVFAIEQLARRRDPTTIEKLRETLRNDPFWGVRLEAAKALRTIQTEEARKALLTLLDEPDDRVRREILAGLASFYRQDTLTVLLSALTSESNPDIQADVIRALGAYSVESVQATILAQLGSTSYRQILADAAVEAIGLQRDPVYLEPLFETLRDRERDFTTSGYAGALHVLAEVASDQPDRTAPREFLIARTGHSKRAVQLAALRALGSLGDPRALPVLETFTGAGTENRHARAAGDAMRRIRDGRPVSVELAALRDEVVRLQTEQDEIKHLLETALKQLEAITVSPPQPVTTPRRRGFLGLGRDR
jgi:aminopeptidase N